MTEPMLKPELRARTRINLSQLSAVWPEASVLSSLGSFLLCKIRMRKTTLQNRCMLIPSWDAGRGVKE